MYLGLRIRTIPTQIFELTIQRSYGQEIGSAQARI